MKNLKNTVEKYNKEHAEDKMQKLDISILISKGYMKKEPSLPDKECNYLSKGDLNTNGEVYCQFHGSLEHPNPNYEKYAIKYRTNDTSPIELKETGEKILKFIIVSFGILNFSLLFSQ